MVDPSVEKDVNYRIIHDGVVIGAYDCAAVMHYPQIAGRIMPKPEGGCSTIGPNGRLTCQEIIATGILGVTAKGKQPLLVGTPTGRTREACNNNKIIYVGINGDVEIHRGNVAVVPVDPTQNEVGWYCGPKALNNTETTSYPTGTNYLLILRSDRSWHEVIFLK